MSVGEQNDVSIPTELPILPLRGVVVYPMMWLPLTVGQERSIRLVDDALVERVGAAVYRAVHVPRVPRWKSRSPDEIHGIGTVAIVHRMLQAPDGTIRLIVQGIERIRVKRVPAGRALLRAEIEVVPDVEEAAGPEEEA